MENFKTLIKPDQVHVIPPLNKNVEIYTEEKDKANSLNNFFTEQTMLDESQVALPQTLKNTKNKLDSITVSPKEVRETMISLHIGKAAGPDLMNNRLLKNIRSHSLFHSLIFLVPL